ncbi:MAG: KpsF/GutQ family sugar-phosphate isomerase [Gammaproteobacteria bacterium]|nr:KpsF/GutQ family sugar-phosphate isomerase [Gammaproteobacteria bacterium]
MTDHRFEEFGRAVIALEAKAVAQVQQRIDSNFSGACRRILACSGRVVVVGMGKSGHIGGKIASTLASTGTPAFFVHPGEASHGDLGMITPKDLVLALSNSGETPEVLTILPVIKRMGVQLIAIVGNTDSSLARQADICLNIGVDQEACPMNLAPTSSTTAALAMGDALAVALLKSRGFTEQDFVRSHPGGAIGRRLLVYVSDIMHEVDSVPLVDEQASVHKALSAMTSKAIVGMTGVLDAEQRLSGIFTDGDLRRALNESVDVYRCPIQDVMTRDPITVSADTLAAELVALMRTKSINGVFVVDEDNRVLGALNMHDLYRAGVV